MKSNPNKYFEENYYKVDYKSLVDLNKRTPSEGITRLLNGLNDFVYGVFVPDDDEPGSETTHLLYAEYKKDFNCYILPVPITYSQADELVFVFAREINIHNPEKEIFEVFNTLQHHRETALETLGYFTYVPNTAPSGTLITVGKKIVPVLKLNRIEFYKEQFNDVNYESSNFKEIENFVYLMVDDTNGLIKIGRSIHPKYREGTLQSKKPQTYMIAHWRVPKQIEKDLHKKFHVKRVRGEWFRLTISDLDEIKEYMKSLCEP